jgi:anti-sigma regulatory factor (Ser/Thr protein kinase)
VKRQDIRPIVLELLAHGLPFSNADVANRVALSRQAIHAQLRQLVSSGELVVEGAGRGVRYRQGLRTPEGIGGPIVRRFPREGLSEDDVWQELVGAAPRIDAVAASTLSIVRYAFTEMLNNAIDHSGSVDVEVRLDVGGNPVWFEVIDHGVGLFERVGRHLHLTDPLEAIEQLSKGKVTTDPAHHTGEGLFFTSRVADRFEAESGEVRWTIDNLRADQAVSRTGPIQGSRIRFELDRATARTLEALFEAYTDDFQFTRTHVVVKLFERGTEFISRSEAKRLTDGLERFRRVTLDFRGVLGVGQGFCDELFRVWARAHPKTLLEPANMIGPVEFLVRRALRHG